MISSYNNNINFLTFIICMYAFILLPSRQALACTIHTLIRKMSKTQQKERTLFTKQVNKITTKIFVSIAAALRLAIEVCQTIITENLLLFKNQYSEGSEIDESPFNRNNMYDVLETCNLKYYNKKIFEKLSKKIYLIFFQKQYFLRYKI